MKFIVMLLMFSSILFSMQKQIIVGSYSVTSNGERALVTLNKQVENDTQLQDSMKEHSLRTINTIISDYTVVSINAFDSYKDLLSTMKALQAYYGDAFVLNYPTKNIAEALRLEDIEKKAAQEQAMEDTADQEKRAELKKLLEMDPSSNEETQEVQVEDEPEALKDELEEEPVAKEVIVEKIPEPEIEEPSVAPVVEEEVLEPVVEEKVTEAEKDNSIYIAILAVLILLVAAVIIFKLANAQAKKQEEDA